MVSCEFGGFESRKKLVPRPLLWIPQKNNLQLSMSHVCQDKIVVLEKLCISRGNKIQLISSLDQVTIELIVILKQNTSSLFHFHASQNLRATQTYRAYCYSSRHNGLAFHGQCYLNTRTRKAFTSHTRITLSVYPAKSVVPSSDQQSEVQ